MSPLRVIVADHDAAAREWLASIIREFDDLELVGLAARGSECRGLMERLEPDLAFIDFELPEVDVVAADRSSASTMPPLVAFTSARDDDAVRAFELNAVDFLRKPVEVGRLRDAVERGAVRLERNGGPHGGRLERAASAGATPPLRRIPVRCQDDIVLLPVERVVSVVAEAEVLHLTTETGERYSIVYRLKDLEERLDPCEFVRISRGTILNLNAIRKITPMSGGTYTITLGSGAHHHVSRIRARMLRDHLMRL